MKFSFSYINLILSIIMVVPLGISSSLLLWGTVVVAGDPLKIKLASRQSYAPSIPFMAKRNHPVSVTLLDYFDKSDLQVTILQ